jgi:hypothetical protein
MLLAIKLAAFLALPDRLLFAHVADHGDTCVAWLKIPLVPRL